MKDYHRLEVREIQRKVWAQDAPWQEIETCPFASYDCLYEDEGAIFVTDGNRVAVASITKRFGKPINVLERPDWWFEWELTDAFGSMTYASGEETGREEIDFVPTHWMPMPPPPKRG